MTDNIQHTGATVSVAEADRQTEAVKGIMAKKNLNYGPAYDVYIKRKQGLLVLQPMPIVETGNS